MQRLIATSKILYVRAAIKPLIKSIQSKESILDYLKAHIEFDELLVPHFQGARPFWRHQPKTLPLPTNSGALGKIIARLESAKISAHPSHAFTGFGSNVEKILSSHDHTKSCFYPISQLADKQDFSMLLLGCTNESPGFSTVHAAQYKLGLSQKHLIRYLLRWDFIENNSVKSCMALESPGCSSSFYKFYEFYEKDKNLIAGNWDGVKWIYIPSAKKAMETELKILQSTPRFIDCKNSTCPTCRLRFY